MKKLTALITAIFVFSAALVSCYDKDLLEPVSGTTENSETTRDVSTEGSEKPAETEVGDTLPSPVPLDGETLLESRVMEINAFIDGKTTPVLMRVSMLERESLYAGAVTLIEFFDENKAEILNRRYAGLGFVVLNTPAEDKSTEIFIYHIVYNADKRCSVSYAKFYLSDISRTGVELDSPALSADSSVALSFSVADSASIAGYRNDLLNFSHGAGDDLRSFVGKDIVAYMTKDSCGLPEKNKMIFSEDIKLLVEKFNIEAVVDFYN